MIKLGFTGDFCPIERMGEVFATGNWKNSLIKIQPFFLENDLNVVDLECPLTNSNAKIIKTGPHLKTDPGTVEMLRFLKVGLVATANNHFYDFGIEGMQNTYSELSKCEIQWVGSGLTSEQANLSKFIQIQGIRLAFINMAENEWSIASDNQAGCNGMDLAKAFIKIKEAKQNADFIIFIAHGGHEHYNLPSPRMKRWYRFLIEAGADAVIAHHTHIMSGFEIYHDCPIFYSLGNFCFDWIGKRDSPWNYGMVLRLFLEKGKPIEYEINIIEQNNSEAGVILQSEQEQKKSMAGIENLNCIIKDDLLLAKHFEQFAITWNSLMSTWTQPYNYRILTWLYRKGLLPDIIRSKKKRLFLNLIRCEAHRDILLYFLSEQNRK